ncbi:MAG: glycoside hydrolase family 2 TIM barrel-domain containing protein [Caldilineaceae bacterium]
MSAVPVYPRPDFDRSHRWQSLDGEWDFAPDPAGVGYRMNWHVPGMLTWTARITAPFPWESPRSGIGREWLPIGWYRCRLQRPAAWADLRTILHFGAAHYHTTVWINGARAGEHTGGYLPFAFDVTDLLEDGQGELIVRVEAPVDKRYLPHGKQRSQPTDDYNDCAFTASSGIWQSVWLEGRPATYIEQVQLRPNAALDAIEATITLQGAQLADARLVLQVENENEQALAVEGRRQIQATLKLTNPQLWSPGQPHLYFVTATLQSANGTDSVKSYTGLRKIEIQGDRLYLNDKQLYVRGALEQGFWPETIHTAPDDNALKRDVELALAAGYNLMRKHIKLENPRWLYWADRLGLLVWEEPACVGRFTPEAMFSFEAQLQPMVQRDGNHPCIVIWGIYNEEWGLDWESHSDPARQQAVERAYDLLAAADPSRPIVDDSGWHHVKTDLVDWHYYDMDMQGWCATTQALATDYNAPFGHGLSSVRLSQTHLSVPGRSHQGKPLLNGEYGGGRDVKEQGWILRWQTADLRRYAAFSGYIYTELYDIEHELVGIYTAARKLKEFGFEPTMVNAETVIIFDHIPLRPGLDYLARENKVAVSVMISHNGDAQIHGQLHWRWDDTEQALGHATLSVNPFTLSPAIPIEIAMPAETPHAKLRVYFLGNDGQCLAYNFMDVANA